MGWVMGWLVRLIDGLVCAGLCVLSCTDCRMVHTTALACKQSDNAAVVGLLLDRGGSAAMDRGRHFMPEGPGKRNTHLH